MIREKVSPEFRRFGPLDGVTILDSGTVTAGPWGASLAADFGAEVIKVESPVGDITRSSPPFLTDDKGHRVGTYWAQDARNKLDIALDLTKPEAKEVFADLLRVSDIWLESSIPGTYARKFGITDEWAHEINPRLVIVHVSGFGQTGDPAYVQRPSYDMIGQAFSCFCELTGFKEGEPMRAGPVINDYITAVWALWTALAGYISAQKTGKGQSIDIAQYEVMFRMLDSYAMDYLTKGVKKTRSGNAHPLNLHPFSIYPAKDGYVAIAAGGANFQRFMEVVPTMKGKPYRTVSDQVQYGQEIREGLVEWLKDLTVAEAEEILVKGGVPCAPIMSIERAVEHPQYVAREAITEWEDPVGGKVKGYGIVPKFSDTPGQIWRGAPKLGHDTDAVLKHLGYSDEQIERLIQAQVIRQSD